MLAVLTLVGAAAALDAACGALSQHGAQRRELQPGEALDLLFETDDLAAAREQAATALAAHPVDWALQPAAERRKRLLVADMDSTIIGCECIDELADFAGRRAEISAITERAMRGELDFEEALKERVAMLAGLPIAALEQCFAERVRLNPGARTLVRTMAAWGARCVLVSGGFTFFTARVAALAGFQDHRANRLLDDGASLTGAVAEPILGRAAKRAALEAEARTAGVGIDAALAIGDGANDLDMIRAAGLGLAYRAKPIVAAQAHGRIAHADLASALFFQGVARDAFVSD